MKLFGSIRTTFQVQTCPNTSESLEKLFQTSKKIKNRNAFAKTVKLFPSLVCLERRAIWKASWSASWRPKRTKSAPRAFGSRALSDKKRVGIANSTSSYCLGRLLSEQISFKAEVGWHCQLYVLFFVVRLFWDTGLYQTRNGLVLPTLHLLIVRIGLVLPTLRLY